MKTQTILFGAVFCAGVCLYATTQTLDKIATDPVADKAHPATMETVQVPSHGVMMNGLVYVAAGAGPHPVVLLLHGFPGNEKNLDLAQAMRRAGWDVLYFDYRGSWGTPGAFSFGHAMEDAQAAVAWVRDPVIAKKLRADPKRIVLVGHSMGGMIAAHTAAEDSSIQAVGLISAADMGAKAALLAKQAGGGEPGLKAVADWLAEEGLAPLAGCTAEGLAQELIAHGSEWSLPGAAAGLAPRSVLVVTSDDGLAPWNDALVAKLTKAGDQHVTAVHLATDHAYSDRRIRLETIVLRELVSLR